MKRRGHWDDDYQDDDPFDCQILPGPPPAKHPRLSVGASQNSNNDNINSSLSQSSSQSQSRFSSEIMKNLLTFGDVTFIVSNEESFYIKNNKKFKFNANSNSNSNSNSNDTYSHSEIKREKFLGMRSIFAAQSPAFHKMLYGNMVEGQLNATVYIRDMDPAVFNYLKNTFLGIEINIEKELVFGILHASRKYLLPLIENECYRYIQNVQTANEWLYLIVNVSKYYNESLLCNSDECATLLDCLFRRSKLWSMNDNSTRFVKLLEKEIVKKVKSVRVFQEIIKSDYVDPNVVTEEFLFELSIKWCQRRLMYDSLSPRNTIEIVSNRVKEKLNSGSSNSNSNSNSNENINERLNNKNKNKNKNSQSDDDDDDVIVVVDGNENKEKEKEKHKEKEKNSAKENEKKNENDQMDSNDNNDNDNNILEQCNKNNNNNYNNEPEKEKQKEKEKERQSNDVVMISDESENNNENNNNNNKNKNRDKCQTANKIAIGVENSNKNDENNNNSNNNNNNSKSQNNSEMSNSNGKEKEKDVINLVDEEEKRSSIRESSLEEEFTSDNEVVLQMQRERMGASQQVFGSPIRNRKKNNRNRNYSNICNNNSNCNSNSNSNGNSHNLTLLSSAARSLHRMQSMDSENGSDNSKNQINWRDVVKHYFLHLIRFRFMKIDYFFENIKNGGYFDCKSSYDNDRYDIDNDNDNSNDNCNENENESKDEELLNNNNSLLLDILTLVSNCSLQYKYQIKQRLNWKTNLHFRNNLYQSYFLSNFEILGLDIGDKIDFRDMETGKFHQAKILNKCKLKQFTKLLQSNLIRVKTNGINFNPINIDESSTRVDIQKLLSTLSVQNDNNDNNNQNSNSGNKNKDKNKNENKNNKNNNDNIDSLDSEEDIDLDLSLGSVNIGNVGQAAKVIKRQNEKDLNQIVFEIGYCKDYHSEAREWVTYKQIIESCNSDNATLFQRRIAQFESVTKKGCRYYGPVANFTREKRWQVCFDGIDRSMNGDNYNELHSNWMNWMDAKTGWVDAKVIVAEGGESGCLECPAQVEVQYLRKDIRGGSQVCRYWTHASNQFELRPLTDIGKQHV